MDFQFWIWVIVVVITLIARANKKKAPENSPTRPAEDSRPTVDSKPITFEDLLREIQASKTAPPVPEPAKTAQYEDYDDDLEEDAKPIEKADYRNEDQIYETYEKAKREAFLKPSLEDTMKVEDTVVRFGQFKGYKQEEKEDFLAEYLKELRDPQGFKKAFVMSEILAKRF